MPSPKKTNQGEQLFLSALPLIDESIRFICRRRHCRPEEAEEFGQTARLRLIEDDYAVLRKFGGRSSLRTYLAVVLKRLFLDFRRQRWGVWRPSAEARRLGPTAVRLDELLHRDGLSLDEAVEVLRTNEGVSATPDELRDLARRLPRPPRRRMEGEAVLAGRGVPAEVVEGPALAGEREARARALCGALRELLAELPADDAMMLRLRFQNDFTVAQIARSQGVEAKPLYRRIGRLLKRLRDRLEARGFNGKDVYDALGLTAWDEEDDAA